MMEAVIKQIHPKGVVIVLLRARPFTNVEAWLPFVGETDSPLGSDIGVPHVDDRIDVVVLNRFDPVLGIPIAATKSSFNTRPITESGGKPCTIVVESSGRTLIRGLAGNCSVAIKKRTYYDFIEAQRPSNFVRDHAVLAGRDYVTGFVVGREEDGTIELDVPQYLEALAKDLARESEEKSALWPLEEETEPEPIPQLPSDIVREGNPVLVVEDNAPLRESIFELLSMQGFEVDVAKGFDDAFSLLALQAENTEIEPTSPPYKLAVIDSNLSFEEANHSGLSLIKYLLDHFDCSILLITGEVRFSEKGATWGDLLVQGFLEKPFDSDEFVRMVQETLTTQGTRLKEILENLRLYEAEISMPQFLSVSPAEPREVRPATIGEALHDLAEVISDVSVSVFEIHPRSHRANCLDGAGAHLNWAPYIGKIGKSVIKDTALSERITVDTRNVARDPRHLWTNKMIEYSAFCGVPIRTSLAYKHALVSFHKSASSLDESFLEKARLCAEQVARALEWDAVTKTRQSEASYVGIGMALGSVAHELGGHISTLIAQTDLLLKDLDENNGEIQTRLTKAKRRLGKIQKEVRTTKQKTEALRGVYGTVQEASVAACLRDAAIRCSKVMREVVEHSERINITIPSEEVVDDVSVTVQAVPAALMMVFFNIYLNAVQQISLMYSVRRNGSVYYSFEDYEDYLGRSWFLVNIHDTGPGIHPEDKERIFEPGFSTKPDGSGLGLFICRHLLGQIRSGKRAATITVTKSVIWDGTTFTVGLPT